uniref:Uncharacterized protein LOC104212535 n=1 Tax=Nicotiana sylvestris TaxID=4096 RepID=A0A1U7UVR9_NICSY|nr:PREDICTED: uncharacterized protein LOC104212535 [Nicotiana sylvestris]
MERTRTASSGEQQSNPSAAAPTRERGRGSRGPYVPPSGQPTYSAPPAPIIAPPLHSYYSEHQGSRAMVPAPVATLPAQQARGRGQVSRGRGQTIPDADVLAFDGCGILWRTCVPAITASCSWFSGSGSGLTAPVECWSQVRSCKSGSIIAEARREAGSVARKCGCLDTPTQQQMQFMSAEEQSQKRLKTAGAGISGQAIFAGARGRYALDGILGASLGLLGVRIGLFQIKANNNVPKGYLAIQIGQVEDNVSYINRPFFIQLLKEAEAVDFVNQKSYTITIPCYVEDFTAPRLINTTTTLFMSDVYCFRS